MTLRNRVQSTDMIYVEMTYKLVMMAMNNPNTTTHVLSIFVSAKQNGRMGHCSDMIAPTSVHVPASFSV